MRKERHVGSVELEAKVIPRTVRRDGDVCRVPIVILEQPGVHLDQALRRIEPIDLACRLATRCQQASIDTWKLDAESFLDLPKVCLRNRHRNSKPIVRLTLALLSYGRIRKRRGSTQQRASPGHP